MSLPGDRVSIPTQQGIASVERTPSGVRVQTPPGELSPDQAGQLSDALRVISQGPSLPGGMSGSGQSFQQQGGQQGNWQGPQRQY